MPISGSPSLYDFEATTILGAPLPMADFRGQVVLVVNVASSCGFTPQYRGLEAIYRRHRDEGLMVLGFPCDQFGAQESGDEATIASFCESTYDVTFPMFAKIKVNGPEAHPLFRWLADEERGVLGSRSIKWNFTKFLVGRDGQVRERYASRTTPEGLVASSAFRAAMAESPT
ncbi:MAG TPA: glutathione peroxidase [Gemmatimonadales bacterium]|nr:glutathione peroxidase [Gemmatimonadales bacterium]